ncbi:hypothetical protein BGX34_001743 [Mortierella sp. NVP85]|nr:hypothetical protein BGX34_001743 [Mortierella sp. NVP85]
MIRLITLAASLALALLSVVVVQAQTACTQPITAGANGTLGTFKVFYYETFTQVTIYGHNDYNQSQTYVLYCGDAVPTDVDLQSKGVSTSVSKFKVPLQRVAAGGTFSSSYIELAGHRDAIKTLYQPQDVVSPCLQKMFEEKAIEPLTDEFNQVNMLDGGFRQNILAEPKFIWIPSFTNVDPLLRIEFITAVSLFFNDGPKGENMYLQIKAAYTELARNMEQIPPANRKRIAWVYYDFERSTWKLRNNDFTKAIIKAAGGIPFPLVGESTDDVSISPRDIKILLRNSQVVIDETVFGQLEAGKSPIQKWRELAGFNSASELPVLNEKAVYSIDNTMGKTGVSDDKYRLPSRPDLLLKDLIQAQYKSYSTGYSFTFLNSGFSYSLAGTRLTSANCVAGNTYNEGAIVPVTFQENFKGDGTTPPAPVGPGMYGTGEYVPDDGKSDGGGGGGGGSKAGVIIAVVCVAAVLVAGFAFVFFKWSRRAKEDRFIELEEEMNNEIPLH